MKISTILCTAHNTFSFQKKKMFIFALIVALVAAQNFTFSNSSMCHMKMGCTDCLGLQACTYCETSSRCLDNFIDGAIISTCSVTRNVIALARTACVRVRACLRACLRALGACLRELGACVHLRACVRACLRALVACVPLCALPACTCARWAPACACAPACARLAPACAWRLPACAPAWRLRALGACLLARLRALAVCGC